MTNTTQCPKCSSIFVITDEQYVASKGNVRCGSCREKFRAVFLPETSNLVISHNAGQENNEESDEGSKKMGSLLEVLARHADEISAQSEEAFQYRQKELVARNLSEKSQDDSVVNDLDMDSSNSFTELASNTEIEMSYSTDTLTLLDDDPLNTELVEEVDALIQSNIFGAELSEVEVEVPTNEPFRLKPKWSTRVFNAFRLVLLLPLGLLLITVLVYQLWLRQMLPEPLNRPILELQTHLAPLEERLSEEYGYSFPVRRDLNSLHLVSATTEAHPTRASTLLLRVSLRSRSNIEQPLPDLELSLTDENGRLVSRRTFSSNDYLYNNATENLIGSNELKKITIELLAFPRQATGYELRMVY